MTKQQYDLLDNFACGQIVLGNVRLEDFRAAVRAAVSVIPFRSVKEMEQFAERDPVEGTPEIKCCMRDCDETGTANGESDIFTCPFHLGELYGWLQALEERAPVEGKVQGLPEGYRIKRVHQTIRVGVTGALITYWDAELEAIPGTAPREQPK